MPNAKKLNCVQKAVPKATNCDKSFYEVVGIIDANTSAACLTVLDLEKCELVFKCHKCKKDEKIKLQKLFAIFLLNKNFFA